MEPESIENLLALAARTIDAGNYDDAQTVLEGVLTLVNHGEAWMGLATVARKRGQPDLALQYLTQAHQASPDSMLIRMAFAEALITNGEVTEARPHLTVLRHQADYAQKAEALLRLLG